jgi:oligoribonuclease NrnB/cAMP/cGMP phosphodiesterase (DHH superfamily)
MDDELIDDEGLPLHRRTLLPGAGFFYPDSLDEERAAARVREAATGASAVVVADTDADGLGCVALVREARDAALDAAAVEADIVDRLGGSDDAAGTAGAEEDDDGDPDGGGEVATDDDTPSPVALVGSGPYSLPEDLTRVADALEPGADVYVCDVCPDEYDPVADAVTALVEAAGSVRWFDHHQWDPAVAEAVRAAGVDLVVGDSDEECSADVALRSLDHDFPAHLVDLAAVTRDHDLWIREDPRSDDLADYAYWADAEEYVTVVGRYGPDLPDPVLAFVEERRVEKRARIDAAVDRATRHEVGPWTVAATYGRCSQNEVAERLREDGADAAVVVKPAGSASIRGSEGFQRCHEVAAQVRGGGHPKAAGCKPDIYDDMLDYANHWTTEGRAAQRVILAAFERVAEDVDGDGDGENPDDGAA